MRTCIIVHFSCTQSNLASFSRYSDLVAENHDRIILILYLSPSLPSKLCHID